MVHHIPTPGDGFSPKLKDEIWSRDKGICVYCGSRGQEVDHVLPRSKKGPAIRSNGVLACISCNRRKFTDISFDWLYIAFRHLLDCGESLDWVDDIWKKAVPDLWRDIQPLSSEPEALLTKLQDSSLEAEKSLEDITAWVTAYGEKRLKKLLDESKASE